MRDLLYTPRAPHDTCPRMASFFNMSVTSNVAHREATTDPMPCSGSRFGRLGPRNPQQPPENQPSPTSTHPPSLSFLQPVQTSGGRFTPTLQSPTTETPNFPAIENMQSMSNVAAPSQNGGRHAPFFFREENSILMVKGNFMTLAAQPIHVDKGEWLAHQGESTLR